jgi:hypothetical protein
METMAAVCLRRVEDSADPAVFVATRLISLLGMARRVELDGLDHDRILLRVGPEIGPAAEDGWATQLFGEVRCHLRARTFAGWEPEPGR